MILDAIAKQIEAEYGRPLAGIEAAVEKEGMVVEGFRLPSAGDKYLSSDLRAKHCTIAFVTDHRLILRPKPRRRILLEETGEVRLPKAGEYGVENDGEMPSRFYVSSYDPARIWKWRELKPGETV